MTKPAKRATAERELERRTLALEWRGRADRLDAYARTLRREHYLADAEDAEAAALDYRIAADELEAAADREEAAA